MGGPPGPPTPAIILEIQDVSSRAGFTGAETRGWGHAHRRDILNFRWGGWFEARRRLSAAAHARHVSETQEVSSRPGFTGAETHGRGHAHRRDILNFRKGGAGG
ncbi:hypothetical protein GCM10027413_16250 [Conyzicola nivalis]|uniref:Uncharacterized protein n=1 Tax=Conyzicola nivalis TaxID=1477021 RepID=A0A916SHJ9_9MICO|nr:hypothetical protein GCM10010979_10370 [Conyzicola nivalis]